MRTGAVQMEDDGIALVVRDGQQNLVNLGRSECSCGRFKHSRPQSACEDIWAGRYYLDPPTPDEFVAPSAGEAHATTARPTQGAPRATHLDDREAVAASKDDLFRGGYKRHAAAYDEALRSEFPKTIFFIKALFDELETIFTWRPQKKRGRHQCALSGVLFAAYMRTYFDWSYRRAEGFMRFLAHPRIAILAENDYPAFNLTSVFIRSPQCTRLLQSVLALTAEPFREIGPLRLAVDGSGIGSNVFYDYRCEARDGKQQARGKRVSFHVHAVVGVDALQVVALRVSGPKKGSEKHVLEKQLLPELFARDYEIDEFLADGGYNSTMIREAILNLGAVPFIPWAKNARNPIPRRWAAMVKHADIIKALFRLCVDEPEKFKNWYRFRVKVEALFSSVKERHGGYVRSLKGCGPENEILMKFICHNIHILLMAAECYGLDIESPFGLSKAA